jgi:ABC-type branched-subunit amino acid transport system ATPase component
MAGSGVVLSVEHLRVVWGGVVAVDDVSLEVGAGSVTGLIGPNGAGKTSLLDAVTGFAPVAGGVVRLDGADITSWTPQRRARAGLTRTFQTLELFDDLTVAENLAVAMGGLPSGGRARGDHTAGGRGFGRRASGGNGAVLDTLERTGLAAFGEVRPRDLSNGQRHLVAVARAVVGAPLLVVLDEPAAGLDPAETAALGRLIADLPARGTTVVLVDHDMDLVLGTCDNVHVLDVGRTIASGPPVAVRADPAVRAAYLGTGAT